VGKGVVKAGDVSGVPSFMLIAPRKERYQMDRRTKTTCAERLYESSGEKASQKSYNYLIQQQQGIAYIRQV